MNTAGRLSCPSTRGALTHAVPTPRVLLFNKRNLIDFSFFRYHC